MVLAENENFVDLGFNFDNTLLAFPDKDGNGTDPKPRHYDGPVFHICGWTLVVFSFLCFLFVLYMYFAMLRCKTDQFNGISMLCLVVALALRGTFATLDQLKIITMENRKNAFVQQMYFELPYNLYMVVILGIIFHHWVLLRTVELVAKGDLVISDEGNVELNPNRPDSTQINDDGTSTVGLPENEKI